MTLAELMVSIGLLVMIGTLVTATVILTLRTTTMTQVRLDDAAQGEVGLAAVSKVLRTAVLPEQLDNQTCSGCQNTAVTKASGTEVRFYANLNNTGAGPSQVTFCVTRTPKRGCGAAQPQDRRDSQPSLVQDTLAPTPSAGGGYSFCVSSCTYQRRVLSRSLVPMSAKSASPPSADALPDVFTFYDYNGAPLGSGALETADLRKISSVDVVLTVRTGGLGYPARTAVTRVRLPNVEINVVNPT